METRFSVAALVDRLFCAPYTSPPLMRSSVNVAVVDDEEQARESVRIALTREGYTVSLFASGREFLSACRADGYQVPDVVIVDYQMPEMDGAQVFQKAVEIEKITRAIFISYSGRFRPDDRVWMRSLGFDFVVPKGDLPALLDIVRRSDEINQSRLARRFGDVSAALSALSKLRIRTIELEETYVKKLISPEVFSILDQAPQSLSPQERDVAVGFVDLRSFTRLMNRLQIHQVNEVLKLFFSHASAWIRSGHGFVDRFVGDGVVWFHHAASMKESCGECIDAAIGMLSTLGALNLQIERRLHFELGVQIRAGIACGRAAVGIFGAPDYRIQYSALGPPVNLAARLCSLAPTNQVLIGGEVIEHCVKKTTRVGFRKIRGFDHKVEVRKIRIPKLSQFEQLSRIEVL
jgi:class 3 adenylate cyclase